jgi:hypothetical protein
MKLAHTVIAVIAAVGFSFAASAAPVTQAPAVNSGSQLTLVHHMHHGHWHHHHHHGWAESPFCLFSLAPWCWH